MADERSRKDRALHRVQEAMEAVATFARIREELLVIRVGTPIGARLDRIDKMIRLNQETLEAIKHNLSIAEADVARESAR